MHSYTRVIAKFKPNRADNFYEAVIYVQPINFFESILSYMSPIIQIQRDGTHLFWNISIVKLIFW